MPAKLIGFAIVLLLVPLLVLPACQSQSQSGEVQFIDLTILEEAGLLVDGKQTSLEGLPATMAMAPAASANCLFNVDRIVAFPLSVPNNGAPITIRTPG